MHYIEAIWLMIGSTKIKHDQYGQHQYGRSSQTWYSNTKLFQKLHLNLHSAVTNIVLQKKVIQLISIKQDMVHSYKLTRDNLHEKFYVTKNV